MTQFRYFAILFLLMAMALPAQARMVEGSIHRSSTVERQPASTWQKLKSKATSTVSSLWNWREERERERKLAEEKALAEKRRAEQQAQLQALQQQLPAVEQTEAKESFKQLIKEAKTQLDVNDAVVTANPGRKGSTQLPSSKAGVPTFALEKKEVRKSKNGKSRTVSIKVDNIPALDIGLEKSISKADFLPLEKLVLSPSDKTMKPLASPQTLSQSTIDAWTKKDIKVVEKWQGPKDNEFGLGKIVTVAKVEKVDVEMTPEKVMEALKTVIPFDSTDEKMLLALILYGRGDKCHVATGLFYDLVKSAKYKDEATFHLGVCAHKMGFHSEAVARLLEVIQTGKSEYIPEAIANLVDGLPTEFEEQVGKAIKRFYGTSSIPEHAKDAAEYVIARAEYKSGNWKEASQFAEKVSEKSDLYGKAQYLRGISLYAAKSSKAESVLQGLLSWMSKTGKSDRNLEALAHINLGRIKFLQKRYEAALQNYKSVPKNHPVWVDALVEQGWIQLNTDDAAGAIGNMYSLHSPYFQSVFMPESWVVRTIGYIDICQYGDAYRTLTKLENLHSGFAKKVDNYLTAKPSSTKMYETVRSYLRGKSNTDVDGLPAQVVREVARKKKFLNLQGAINTKEDELSQYGFIEQLLVKEFADLKARKAAALDRKKKALANLAKIKTKKELAKHKDEWQASVRAEHALVRKLIFEMEVHSDGLKGYRNMRRIAQARIDREKSKLKSGAGTVLLSELKEVRRNLLSILEGNEFLRYEIFAGSGEDIRYQAAGGKTVAGSKIPANVKPQKILNWEFDGEYWEDEIGSYRSTLTNNCPKRTRSTASVTK